MPSMGTDLTRTIIDHIYVIGQAIFYFPITTEHVLRAICHPIALRQFSKAGII